VLAVVGMALIGCGGPSGDRLAEQKETAARNCPHAQPAQHPEQVTVANLVESPLPLAVVQTAFEEQEQPGSETPHKPRSPLVVHVAPPGESGTPEPASPRHVPVSDAQAVRFSKPLVLPAAEPVQGQPALRITLKPDGQSSVAPGRDEPARSSAAPVLKLQTATNPQTAMMPPAAAPQVAKTPPGVTKPVEQTVAKRTETATVAEPAGEHSVLVRPGDGLNVAAASPDTEPVAAQSVPFAQPTLKVATAPSPPPATVARLRITVEPATAGVSLTGETKTAARSVAPSAAQSTPPLVAADAKAQPAPSQPVAHVAPPVTAAVPYLPARPVVAESARSADQTAGVKASTPVQESQTAAAAAAMPARAAVPPLPASAARVPGPPPVAPGTRTAPAAPRPLEPMRVVVAAPAVVSPPVVTTPVVEPVDVPHPSSTAATTVRPEPMARIAAAQPKHDLPAAPRQPQVAVPAAQPRAVQPEMDQAQVAARQVPRPAFDPPVAAAKDPRSQSSELRVANTSAPAANAADPIVPPTAPQVEAPQTAMQPVAPPPTSVPVPPAAFAPRAHVPAQGSALASVSQRVQHHVRYAFSLAGRGAIYSAKAELTDALRLVAMAQDADHGTSRHNEAMIAGLTALREADDFAARDGQPDVRLDVARLVATHATPVLKNSITPSTTPIEALQTYYGFARQQLTIAGGRDIGASMALYGMARLQVAQPGQPGMNGPKAITLHQAALAVDANNYMAANELGVLLARYGQLREAETALKHSAAISPQPETWRNLAEVYRRQGAQHLEGQARQQSEQQLAARRSGRAPNPTASGIVDWVDPATFVAMSEAGPGSAPVGELAAAAAAATTPKPEAAPAESDKPWSLQESIRGLTSRFGQSSKR